MANLGSKRVIKRIVSKNARHNETRCALFSLPFEMLVQIVCRPEGTEVLSLLAKTCTLGRKLQKDLRPHVDRDLKRRWLEAIDTGEVKVTLTLTKTKRNYVEGECGKQIRSTVSYVSSKQKNEGRAVGDGRSAKYRLTREGSEQKLFPLDDVINQSLMYASMHSSDQVLCELARGFGLLTMQEYVDKFVIGRGAVSFELHGIKVTSRGRLLGRVLAPDFVKHRFGKWPSA